MEVGQRVGASLLSHERPSDWYGITDRIACVNRQSKNPTSSASVPKKIRFTHFLPASVAQQQQNREAGQQTIFGRRQQHVSIGRFNAFTYGHTDCDHETNCRPNDLAMAGILIADLGQHVHET